MSEDRVLHLEGVHNFRDYGGYGLIGGGRLRRGLLWRSGQHHGASDADLERIAALGLVSVFDLRSSRERSLHPCRRPAGFAAQVHCSADPDRARQAPHVEAARTRRRDLASTIDSMVRNYQTMAFRPELLDMIRLMLADLAEGRGPSLVNCMAGKDRTGIAVAMVQLTAGMHRDDVMADYLLTNTAGDMEARVRSGMETVRAVTGEVPEEVARALMGVQASYLETAFAAIDERHGTLEAYLAEVLGADAMLRERLRAALGE